MAMTRGQLLMQALDALEAQVMRCVVCICRFHPTRVVHRGIAEVFLNQTGSTLFGIPSH